MILVILLPRPLSNEPQFIQFIYRYSHATKRFVELHLILNLKWFPLLIIILPIFHGMGGK